MTVTLEPSPDRQAPVPSAPGRRGVAAPPIVWPLLAAAALLLLGVALRWPIADYDGPAEHWAFNAYILRFLGAYSDIAQLYFRDELWRHSVPYVDYPLEYPVGIGALVWLLGFIDSGVLPYFTANAAVLVAAGLLVVALARRFAGANPWLLALSPTLTLYVVLNWDLVGVLLMVVSLLLFDRERDGWGALALAAAVSTKLFPIVLLPLVLLERLLRHGWRRVVLIGSSFGIASVLFNAPVALEPTPAGLRLREHWLYFFRFNKHRPPEITLWKPLQDAGLTVDQINIASALLFVLGLGIAVGFLYQASRRRESRTVDLLLPAALATLSWLFFINKINNPQYSLWVAVLLALAGAPVALAAAFAVVEVGFFTAVFTMLYLNATQSPALPWFNQQVLLPAIVLREGAILAVVLWAVTRLARAGAAHPRAEQAASAAADIPTFPAGTPQPAPRAGLLSTDPPSQ